MPNWKKTTWRPDTCGCEVIYEFDHDLPLEGQDPVVVSVTLCADHAGLPPGLQDKFDHILRQNQRKNEALEEAYLELGIDESDGKAFEKLFDQYVDRWYMSGKNEDRVVHIKTKNLNQGQRNSIQQRANRKHGSGKVVVE